MKNVILTSKARRQRDSLVSMINACCDIKQLETDNLISMCQSFQFFINILIDRQKGLDAERIRLYRFNQGELDELS